jgi:ATP-binding cassette subfamily B protein/subfamily B ATP-binding cassette protein MsbA
LAALILLFAVGVTLADLLPPWLIKITIDDVIQGKNQSLLPWILMALLGTFLIKNLCAMIRIRLNNTLEQKVIFDLRDHVYRCLQGLSLRYFENRSTGEIMSRVINDVNNVERVFIDGIENLVMALLTLCGITIALFFMSWKLALIALMPIPILVVSAFFFTKRIHKLYQIIREKSAQLNALLQDSLSGIRETMSFHRGPYEIQRFNTKNQSYCQSNLEVAKWWSLYSPGMILLGSLGTLLVLWVGTHQVLAQELTVGGLVAFLTYLTLFYTPINQIHTINHMLQHALAAGERVFEIIDSQPEINDPPNAISPKMKAQGHIQFTRVSFQYRIDTPTIQNIDFEAQPGEKLAFVGPSGGGKSTLIKLLMRFYDIDRGRIAIDGMDIRQFRLGYLRDQMALVSQEPFLFNGTVLENILYGHLSASEKEVREAAEAAHAHDFIQELPEGYSTWIGERGVKLSVGQKQRIAIARALLKDPPIIIFDEATSNIDTETESKIQDALFALTQNRTTLIIAHRLSTLKYVDKILVIDQGKLVEQGNHEQLLLGNGLYSLLYEAQFQI